MDKREIEKVLVEAYKKSFDWRLDKLEKTKSLREMVDGVSFVTALKLLHTEKISVPFCQLRNLESEKRYDFGFWTMASNTTDPDYFLWIFTSIKDGEKIVKKFNLEKGFR